MSKEVYRLLAYKKPLRFVCVLAVFLAQDIFKCIFLPISQFYTFKLTDKSLLYVEVDPTNNILSSLFLV